METFVSAESFDQDYYKITENRYSAAAIASADTNSGIVAESALKVLEDRLGRVTTSLITLVDPEVIVVIGMAGTIDQIYGTVPRKWPGCITVRAPMTRLLQAKGGDPSTA